MQPKVSVIVPVYNAESHLKRCFTSIKQQTLKNIEIVFVNDGSTDNSHTELARFCSSDKRVVVIEQFNAGTGEARNTGIRSASGEYICFVDSDDTLEPTMLETLVAMSHDNADIVVCGYLEIFALGKTKTHVYSNTANSEDYFKSVITFEQASPVWAKLFKKRLFDNPQCYFPKGLRNNEDNATLYKLLYFAKKIKFVDKPLYNWIRTNDSKSMTINTLRIKETFEVLSARKVFLKSHDLLDEYLSDFYKGVIFTLVLRQNQIRKYCHGLDLIQCNFALHSSITQSELIHRKELRKLRNYNAFDYWKFVFFAIGNVSQEHAVSYKKLIDPVDWDHALNCVNVDVQSEIYSLNQILFHGHYKDIYVYGVGETWQNLKPMLDKGIKIRGFIDQSFGKNRSSGKFDLNVAYEEMETNSVILVASITQAEKIVDQIKAHLLYKSKKPILVTFVGVIES